MSHHLCVLHGKKCLVELTRIPVENKRSRILKFSLLDFWLNLLNVDYFN